MHALDDLGELKVALGEDGALEAIKEAKEQGIIKHICITSHNPVNILEAIKSFSFDTILLPVNRVLHAHPEPRNDYAPVLSLAKKKDLGVIAMKSIAKGPWPSKKRTHNTWYQPFTTQTEVANVLRFTLSQEITAATSSSDIRIAKMMIETAEQFTRMKKEEQRELVLKASVYKPLFPSTLHNQQLDA